MKSSTLTKLFKMDNFPSIDENFEMYKYYIQQCEEVNEQKYNIIVLKNFILDIIHSDNFDMFKSCLNNIKK